MHNEKYRSLLHKLEVARQRPTRLLKEMEHARQTRQKLRTEGFMGDAALRARVWAFDCRCGYCGAAFTVWDHFIPVVRGGTNTYENMVPACSACNSSKSGAEPMEWCFKKFGAVGFWWVRLRG